MPSWGSRRTWPPPPRVETEDDSLANELFNDADRKSEDHVPSRGTVDQASLILEADEQDAKPLKHGDNPPDHLSNDSHSSDESAGPPTPRSSSPERRRPYMSSRTPSLGQQQQDRRERQARDPGAGNADNGDVRGRPAVSTIDTTLDPQIQQMLSGNRRAPSPYRMVHPEQPEPSTAKSRFSGDFLLSPDAITSPPGRIDGGNRRPVSAQPPKDRHADERSSDDRDREGHNRRRSFRNSSSTSNRPPVVLHDARSRGGDPPSDSGRQNTTPDALSKKTPSETSRSGYQDYEEAPRQPLKRDSLHPSSGDDSRSHHRDRSHRRDKSRARTPRPSSTERVRPVFDDATDRKSKHPEEDSHRARRDEYSDSERLRSKRDSVYLSSADEANKGRRERSRAPPRVSDSHSIADSHHGSSSDEARRRHRDRSQAPRERLERRPTLDVPGSSSSDDSRRRHRDRSHVRERSSARSSRPSLDSLPKPMVDPRNARGSLGSSPVLEQAVGGKPSYIPNMTGQVQSPGGRRHGSTVVPPTASAPSPVDVERAIRHHQGMHGHSPMPSARPSPRASPSDTPPRTPGVSQGPRDYFPPAPLGVPGQGLPQRSRTPSRAETLDNHRKPANDRPMGTRPPLVSTQSSRSSSDFHSGSTPTTPVFDSRHRTTGPPTIDQRIPPRSAVHGSSAAEQPRPVQRAFSYSTADLQGRGERGRYHGNPNVSTLAARPHQRPQISAPPSQDQVPRRSTLTVSPLDLPVCKRSKPVSGYHDWYMFQVHGLDTLRICPTCLPVIINFPFRNYPLVPVPPSERAISCSLSQPWIRRAWLETIKQGHRSLDMFRLVAEQQFILENHPCHGPTLNIRSWYTIEDPKSRRLLPDFNVCSACTRSIEEIYPAWHRTFVRRDRHNVQEKSCSLNCNSSRFDRYLDLIEAAVVRSGRSRTPDTTDFVNYSLQIPRHAEECARDTRFQDRLWHYLPGLPEFTVCEHCYNTVIYPQRHKPVADRVTSHLQVVPSRDPTTWISCQLYSDRTRNAFRRAMDGVDSQETWAGTAKRRCLIEHFLNEKKVIIMEALERGDYSKVEELKDLQKQWEKVE